jgi:hypothetical protein
MFGLSGAELAAAEADAARSLAAADRWLEAAERQLRAPRATPPLAPGGAWAQACSRVLRAALGCADGARALTCSSAPAAETPLGLPKAGEDWRDVWYDVTAPQPAPEQGAGDARDRAGACAAQLVPLRSAQGCDEAALALHARPRDARVCLAGDAQPARGNGGDSGSDDGGGGGSAAGDAAAGDAAAADDAYRRGCDALDADCLDEAVEAFECAARACPAAYPGARAKIAAQLAAARGALQARAAARSTPPDFT